MNIEKYLNDQKLIEYIKQNYLNEKVLDKYLFTENIKTEELNRILRLCAHLEIGSEEINKLNCKGEDKFEYKGEEYLVLTDKEADLAHKKYIADMVYDLGFDGSYGYNTDFNVELKDNGDIIVTKESYIEKSERVKHLSEDGKEHMIDINGTTFYIYKTN